MNGYRLRRQSLFAGLILIASCRSGVRAAAEAPPSASALSAMGDDASAIEASRAKTSRRQGAKPVPLRGEPDAEELAEARLVPSSCGENEAAVRDERIAKMRKEVDAAFAAWQSRRACASTGYRQTCEDAEEYSRRYEDRYYAPPPSAAYGGPSQLGGFARGSNGGYAAPPPRPAAPMPAPAMAYDSASAPASKAGAGVSRSAMAREAPEGAPAKAASASGTNNQVEGVDEADIVKNDGTYVYLAANGALRIVEALHPRLLSVTPVRGAIREMLVEKDRAILFVANGSPSQKQCKYAYDCEVGADGTSTSILVYDISDRNSPKRVREIGLSGSLIAARRIGDAVHTVVADDGAKLTASYPTTISNWGGDCQQCVRNVSSVRAKFEELKRENEERIRAERINFPSITENGSSRQLCDVMHTRLGAGDSFTSVISFDLNRDRAKTVSATLNSRPGAVFASEQGLYISVTHHKQSGGRKWYPFAAGESEVSDIHKFHVGASPSETKYVGSGVVPGHVLNQFAMDESDGYLRVATTRGKVPEPNVSSSISVLAEAEGGNLVRIGAVDHIAPSEDIRAVRFDDDRGYIVTFKKTDPLFVVDLSRATAPEIMGELKIPGFSTYLHRIDPNHLLSIGFDAVDHGNFAYFDGLLLQLFDVTRPTDPVLLYREKIGSRGSSSEAATDHLAFNFMQSRGLLAIPVTTCKGGGDGTYGDVLTFSGLAIYDVSVKEGFHKRGGVDHGPRGANCQTWWSNAQSMVKRSIFMDDLVFSIADDQMKVQHLGELGRDVASIPLTGLYSRGGRGEEEGYY